MIFNIGFLPVLLLLISLFQYFSPKRDDAFVVLFSVVGFATALMAYRFLAYPDLIISDAKKIASGSKKSRLLWAIFFLLVGFIYLGIILQRLWSIQ